MFEFVLFVFLNLQPTFIKTSQVRKRAGGREMRLSFKQLSEKKTQQNTLRKDKIIALAEKQLTDFSSLISDFQH